jgi:hypothetical protein
MKLTIEGKHSLLVTVMCFNLKSSSKRNLKYQKFLLHFNLVFLFESFLSYVEHSRCKFFVVLLSKPSRQLDAFSNLKCSLILYSHFTKILKQFEMVSFNIQMSKTFLIHLCLFLMKQI